MRSFLMFIFVLVLMSGFSGAADSPVDKGSVALGGQFYYQRQSGDLYQSYYDYYDRLQREALDPISTYVFDSQFGYFVRRGFMVGLEVTAYHYIQDRTESTSFGIGPRFGYYADPNPNRDRIPGAVYPYLSAFLTIGSRDSRFSQTPKTITRYGGQFGFMTMISNTLGIDMGLRITGESIDVDGKSIGGTTVFMGGGISGFIY